MKFRTLLPILLLLVVLGPASVMTASVNAAGPDQVVIQFHPVNPNYWQIKAAIDSQAPKDVKGPAPKLGNPPVAFVSAAGQGPTIYSPSDSNGAVGTDRYIETVNVSTGVYDRNLTLLSQNSEAAWTGFSCALGDPVIMYAPKDQRFYAALICASGSNYTLLYGFSKGNSPSANNADWCFYNSSFGGRYGFNLPDYPKLGDSADKFLIGVNVFPGGGFFVGADIAWVQKPPAGVIQNCPTNLKTGVFQNIKNKDGTLASTPNPLKQADTIPQGVVISNKDANPSTILTVHIVTAGTCNPGCPTLSAPKQVNVASYSYPPSAPQCSTTKTLDTLDARLMSGWLAKDTSGVLHGWTGHTVKSASGRAEFRWYDITQASMGAGMPNRTGVINDSSLYVFMGAIAPDRNGATGQFGNDALSVFNTSSSTVCPAVAMSSFIGSSGLQSAIVTVFTSPGPDTDFTCNNVCRWGDYSGASADPAAVNSGQVWGTAMTSKPNGNNPGWGTWNFGAK